MKNFHPTTALADADESDIEEIVRPCGTWKK